MNLKKFRELTKDLPDNTILVQPTYVNCYTEVDAIVVNNLIDLSVDSNPHNAWQEINLPDDELFPSVVFVCRRAK